MPGYRLTRAAAQDLVEIARYGDRTFGVAASDAFRARIESRFNRIAEQPLLYPSVEHVKAGYRRSVLDGLSIFSRLDDDRVTIVRVIGRQNPDFRDADPD